MNAIAMRLPQVLKTAVLLLLVLFLGWRIVAFNLADYYTARALEGDVSALDTALWWRPEHPRALALKGRQLFRQEAWEEAEAHLAAAVQANPADARPLVDLARLRALRGEAGLADEMMESAKQLMPVHPRVQRDLGLYWVTRGQPERAIEHLAIAMSGDIGLRDEFFPAFLALAEDPASSGQLAALAANPPRWWPQFFRYAAANANTADTLARLVDLRQRGDDGLLSDDERLQFIARLQRDGRVDEAYLQWVNGLNSEALQALGYVFNGDFELELLGHGFGWISWVPRNSGFQVTRGDTYGAQGEYALRLGFAGKRERFHYLYQHLYLPEGHYRLSGEVRPDKLEARRGLQWRVYCSVGEGGTLAESELFAGTGDWRSFSVDFAVPDGCPGQVLRLYSAGNREVDHELKGGIWFDALQIERSD